MPTNTPAKRVRRTKAQIAADEKAEREKLEKLAAERAAKIPAPKIDPWKRTVHFLVEGYTACGKVWEKGDTLVILEDSPEFRLSFDAYSNFIFDKSPEEQLEKWGEVRYVVDPADS